jgi:hypothetical protein
MAHTRVEAWAKNLRVPASGLRSDPAA